MKLDAVRVQRWRNFIDSGWVPADASVTCLVGKNEAGKSAFLEALYRLNPAYARNSGVDVDLDYPRWRKVQDRKTANLTEVEFVTASFLLDQEDVDALAAHGAFPVGSKIELGRRYDGLLTLRFEVDEAEAVKELIAAAGVKVSSFPTSLEGLVGYAKDSGRDDLKPVATKARKLRSAITDTSQKLFDAVRERVPTFFYFSDYSRLEGDIDLTDITSRAVDKLEDHERTALALLGLVDASAKELTAESIEKRLAELEAAASEVSRQVFAYWTQNRHLHVQFHTRSELVRDARGMPTIEHRYLNIRLLDRRHDMTTNFETRSSGFRWFFSFIVAFDPFRDRKDVVVLLDEPGLSLHGKAQSDFLRFIDEQLAPTAQVMYTTHSPFLVAPSRLERVRVVEDHTSEENRDLGAVVSTEAYSRDADTLFPLQAALGYDLAQNLFIGAAEHLVVEGTTDLVYLDTMSEHLAATGRIGLDERFSVVPVGGIQNVPTFVALLGAHVDVSVLVDSSTKGMQRITNLIEKDLLPKSRFVTVGQVTKTSDADIEDLFDPAEYVKLYNAAFSENVKVSDLDGNGPVIKQLERLRGKSFDHGKPATQLLTRRDDVLGKLSDSTLDRFEQLFQLLNGTLPAR